jgi:hypothetical protein
VDVNDMQPQIRTDGRRGLIRATWPLEFNHRRHGEFIDYSAEFVGATVVVMVEFVGERWGAVPRAAGCLYFGAGVSGWVQRQFSGLVA